MKQNKTKHISLDIINEDRLEESIKTIREKSFRAIEDSTSFDLNIIPELNLN